MKTEDEDKRVFFLKNKRTNMLMMAYCVFDDKLSKKDVMNMQTICDVPNSEDVVHFEFVKMNISSFEKAFGKVEFPAETKFFAVRFFEERDGVAFPLLDFIDEQENKVKIWLSKVENPDNINLDEVFKIDSFFDNKEFQN